jgi:predicted nuclease of predicted toxin-antitoxin system
VEFVADESCAGPVIRALRAAGHDVLAIAESAPGASDEVVIARALGEGRVLLTEDRDFGELVHARGRSSAGVVFVKFPSRARRAKPVAVVEAVAKLGARLRDGFTVVESAGCGWPGGPKSIGARSCAVSRARHSPPHNLTSWRLRCVAALDRRAD